MMDEKTEPKWVSDFARGLGVIIGVFTGSALVLAILVGFNRTGLGLGAGVFYFLGMVPARRAYADRPMEEVWWRVLFWPALAVWDHLSGFNIYKGH